MIIMIMDLGAQQSTMFWGGTQNEKGFLANFHWMQYSMPQFLEIIEV